MIILKQWDLLGQFKVVEKLKYVYLFCLCCGVKDFKLVGMECCKENPLSYLFSSLNANNCVYCMKRLTTRKMLLLLFFFFCFWNCSCFLETEGFPWSHDLCWLISAQTTASSTGGTLTARLLSRIPGFCWWVSSTASVNSWTFSKKAESSKVDVEHVDHPQKSLCVWNLQSVFFLWRSSDVW